MTTQQKQFEIEKAAWLAKNAKCEKCRCSVDGNSCFSRKVNSTWNGSRVAMKEFYCEPCRQSLVHQSH